MKKVILILLVVGVSGVPTSAALVLTNGDLAASLTAQTTTSGDGNGNGAEPVLFGQFVAPNTGGRRFGWSNANPKYQAIVHEQTSTPGRNRGFYYAFDDNGETTGRVPLSLKFVNETNYKVDVGVGFFGWNDADVVRMDLGGNVSVAESIPNTTDYQIGMTVLGPVDYFTSSAPEVMPYSHTFDLGTVPHDNIAFVVFVRTAQDTTFTIAANGGTGATFYFDDFRLDTGTRKAAREPRPAEGQPDVPREGVILEWTAGESAVSHDVYFGTTLEEVSQAAHASPAFLGNRVVTAFALDRRLEFDRTYYWRIDEVAGDGTVSQGAVWNFTVEPIAYPIDQAGITATASTVSTATMGPQKTIDGSGLDAADQHSTDGEQMWLSANNDPAPWILYTFDKVYKLDRILVWNSNQLVETAIGFGAKTVKIEHSLDGAAWTALGDFELAQGSGLASYTANTTIGFAGGVTRYVRLSIVNNWGGIVKQYGLSEVRFFSVPVRARDPQPASGATGADVKAPLSWRSGREAARHQVHVSTDPQAVIDETAPTAAVSQPQYAAAMNLDTTYYWKVVEVNEAKTPATWPGEVWSFTTQEYLVVDDFESYTDDLAAHTTVFDAWSDGFADGFKSSGSTVGNESAPFAERTIIHAGKQAMPLAYNNTLAISSEATRTFASPQDWTRHGVKGLTLWFYGDPANAAQQMYVKIDSAKILYDADAADLQRAGWKMWYIDLTGRSVASVTKLSIGLDRLSGIGGQGKVLIDDLRLYPRERSLITPVDPGTAGLQARYQFEGNFDDSSGKGRKGSAVGAPLFVPGKLGQAISLDGFDDYVNIDGYKGILADAAGVQQAFTICAWIKTATDGMDIIAWGTNTAGQRMNFRVDTVLRLENGSGNMRGTNGSSLLDDEWHHVAATVPQGGTLPDIRLYVDGRDVSAPASATAAFNLKAGTDVALGMAGPYGGRFFNGPIDEVRLYDRVLSAAEIAALAGRTIPFDQPF